MLPDLGSGKARTLARSAFLSASRAATWTASHGVASQRPVSPVSECSSPVAKNASPASRARHAGTACGVEARRTGIGGVDGESRRAVTIGHRARILGSTGHVSI
jgi:hypothetical protein